LRVLRCDQALLAAVIFENAKNGDSIRAFEIQLQAKKLFLNMSSSTRAALQLLDRAARRAPNPL